MIGQKCRWRTAARPAGRPFRRRSCALARKAAATGSTPLSAGRCYGERLLADIHKILDGKDAISTSNLAFHLGEMEEQPWPTIRNGKEINGHVLAGMLKEYGIKPDQVWIDGKNHLRAGMV